MFYLLCQLKVDDFSWPFMPILYWPLTKGGIERLWETLQDRLTKDMKRKGVCTVEQANEFLKKYIPYYNRKFAVQASNPEKAYLPKRDMFELQLIFAKHETRKLDSSVSRFSRRNSWS